MTPEALLKDLRTLKCDKALLGQYLNSAVKLTFVEKFSEGFERPCNENDFASSKKTRESHIIYIKHIVENLANPLDHNVDKTTSCHSYPDDDNELLALIVVMCGENITLQPWNTQIIVQNCKIVLSKILKILNCCDISQLISKYHKVNLVADVLNILSPNLLTTTWKHFPASVACYEWFLLTVKQPTLSSYLNSILPPALLLVDDFINENKITGVKCLSHIVQNIATAELQFYGHGDVIYSALLPLIQIREADLLGKSVPLIILLATKLEFNFRNQNEFKWSRFDSILEILLENMELEQLTDLRNCYISHLGLVIDRLKYKIIRWSKRLLRIFEEYIQTAAKFNDEKSMSFSVEAVEKYINYSKEVIPLHRKKLLYIILVALVFTYNSSTENHAENEQKLVRCLIIILKSISKTAYDDFKLELYENFKNTRKHLKFYEYFKSVVEEHTENSCYVNEANKIYGNS